MRILRSDALDELRFDHRGCRLLAVEDRLNCDAKQRAAAPASETAQRNGRLNSRPKGAKLADNRQD
jgi:hypothetical protein